MSPGPQRIGLHDDGRRPPIASDDVRVTLRTAFTELLSLIHPTLPSAGLNYSAAKQSSPSMLALFKTLAVHALTQCEIELNNYNVLPDKVGAPRVCWSSLSGPSAPVPNGNTRGPSRRSSGFLLVPRHRQATRGIEPGVARFAHDGVSRRLNSND